MLAFLLVAVPAGHVDCVTVLNPLQASTLLGVRIVQSPKKVLGIR